MELPASSAAIRLARPGSLSSVGRRPRGGRFSPAQILLSACFFISITGLAANHAQLAAQEVTSVAPPAATVENALYPELSGTQYPDAELIPPPSTEVSIVTDDICGKESRTGNLFVADCHVAITYRGWVLQADHIEYNSDTGDVDMTGHVVVTRGETAERVEASHGTINIKTETGRFFDVVGSVGSVRKAAVAGPAAPASTAATTERYKNDNPFLFTGRMAVMTGPKQYAVYDGTITSCQLPNPDWLLSAKKFDVNDTKAWTANSLFHLMGLPVLWMPYVTHPTDVNSRQSGILIPELGINSASKGETIGEQVYWAVNRSTNLTVGTIYYSARGWEQTGSLWYRGLGLDFIKSRYSALQDRGYYPGGVYVNQSGTDVTFSARHDLVPADESAGTGAAPSADPPLQERAVVDLEYLSSFPYREAFSTNFNQAVSSDVVSTIYLTREQDGTAASLEGDRYQGEKRVESNPCPPNCEEQVHIFHAPALEFTTTDHALGLTGLEWDLDSSATALKRAQPYFTTSGMIERLDVRPELAYPLHFGGWNLRPSVAGRETFYSRSRLPVAVSPAPGLPAVPVEVTAALNRAALDVRLDARAPVLERTFDSGWIRKLARHDVKHTIEPEVTYRYITGIDSFPETLRFDLVDIASNTNEVEYGVTQRLFLREKGDKPCHAAGAGADATEILGSAGQAADAVEDPGEALGRDEAGEPVCGNREWISWRVAQKYFFDPTFGGAVSATPGPRAILDTTLDFSGISFMTRQRDISPIVSRMRVRTSEKTDVEWDFDYDTCSAPSAASVGCSRKFTANNLYVDVHDGSIAAGTIIGRLNAPARSYVNGSLSSVADFTQMRVWAGFGKPNRPGFSAAASAGIDLDLGTVQYGAIQTSYNWNCCGLSVEYRKFELGTARNDNGYKFNFTLANIGSAGNLRHQDQLF
jgi:LPS-assembly protein